MNTTKKPTVSEITESFIQATERYSRQESRDSSHYAYQSGLLIGFLRTIASNPRVLEEMQRFTTTLTQDVHHTAE